MQKAFNTVWPQLYGLRQFKIYGQEWINMAIYRSSARWYNLLKEGNQPLIYGEGNHNNGYYLLEICKSF
jgi:hypothetical protein